MEENYLFLAYHELDKCTIYLYVDVCAVFCLLVIPPPSEIEVIDASESQLSLAWIKVNTPPDYYIIYWRTDNGPEYNVTTSSDDNSYILNDDRLTPATMYYISATAVTWYNTSDPSNTTYAGTGLSSVLNSSSEFAIF